MAKYQSGDMATFYFIIKEINGNKQIQAWTDNREIAKFYIEFHNCKNFRIKSITNTIDEIEKIVAENLHDEIKLANIIVKNREKKNKHEDYITVCIPATNSELRYINEEVSTFMSTNINYSLINDALPYLKNKYQEVLQSIFLTDIIHKVIYSKNVKIAQMVEFDQLMVLFKSFPENFEM